MRDFVAIDFETANSHRESVCSVGIVVVRDGVVQDTFSELIRPAPNYYSHWATDIHGIGYFDTAEAQEFPDVWARIVPLIEGLPLVAHNSPFDEGCLRRVHEHYGMEYPGYEFHCTCRMSRKAFPDLPNHRLPTVARHIGFDFKNHHNALADAEACARIAIKTLLT
jgi:DNA polymerase-3 subunit epsilon